MAENTFFSVVCRSLLSMDSMPFKTAEQRPEVRSIALISVRTSILTTPKNLSGAPQPPLFVSFLLFTLGNNMLDKKVVKFDFRIGHVFVIFPLL